MARSILLLLLVAFVVVACSARNPARVDYYLQALAAAEDESSLVTIDSIKGADRQVELIYQRIGQAGFHRLSCGFAGSAIQLSQLELQSIAIDDRIWGPGRTAFLKSHWLGTHMAMDGAEALRRPITRGYFSIGPEAGLYVQTALSALPIASVYVLLGLGFALVYGVTGRINIVHGELATIGAYAGYMGFFSFGAGMLGNGIVASVIFALVAAGCAGFFTMRAVFLPLARRHGQMLLVASAGLIIVYEEAVRLSHNSRELWLPPILADPIALSPPPFTVTVTPMQLVIGLFASSVTIATFLFMRLTRFGLAWRGVSDDALAAQFMGISPSRILAGSAALASSLAGLAGVALLLGYGNANHAMGLMLSVKAMVAALLGGMGSLSGAVLGALLLVTIETVWVIVFGGTYRDAAVFVILIALLTLLPDGVFNRQGK